MLLIYLSIRERVFIKRKFFKRIGNRPLLLEDSTSLFSSALTDLVETAGGIYVCVIMLIDFLKIDIPEKVELVGIYVEPIAFISLLLAVVQPFILRIFDRF